MRPVPRTFLAIVAAIGLALLGGCRSKTEGTSARGSEGKTLAELLASDDPVERRIAQANVAHRGAESLPELEALCGT